MKKDIIQGQHQDNEKEEDQECHSSSSSSSSSSRYLCLNAVLQISHNDHYRGEISSNNIMIAATEQHWLDNIRTWHGISLKSFLRGAADRTE